MTIHRTIAVAVALAAGGLLVAGCSTEDAVSQSEVEDQIAGEVGDGAEASCPDDLTAEVGETMDCDVTLGDGTEIAVTVEVTSIEGDTANFSITEAGG